MRNLTNEELCSLHHINEIVNTVLYLVIEFLYDPLDIVREVKTFYGKFNRIMHCNALFIYYPTKDTLHDDTCAKGETCGENISRL